MGPASSVAAEGFFGARLEHGVLRGIEDARQAAQDVPDVPWSFAPMPTKSAEAPHIRRLSEPKYVKCTESGNYKAVVKALSRAVTSGMLPTGGFLWRVSLPFLYQEFSGLLSCTVTPSSPHPTPRSQALLSRSRRPEVTSQALLSRSANPKVTPFFTKYCEGKSPSTNKLLPRPKNRIDGRADL